MPETVTFQAPPTGADAPPAADPKTQVAERPEWLPSNFNTAEDLVKSFDETKAALTRAQQELAKVKGTPPAEPPKPEDAPADKKPEEGGLEVPEDDKKSLEEQAKAAMDFTPFTEEFNSTGDVAPESRKKIVEGLKGVFGEHTEAIVNDYIEGSKSRAQNAQSEIKKLAGGDDGYATMVGWAAGNLTPEEKAAFNKAVNSGDFHTASFAVTGLRAKYEAANGKPPRLLDGGGGVPSSSGAFANIYEMVAAQRDPRYGKDPNYTKSVEERVRKSNF